MALVDVHTIILKNTVSHGSFFMSVGHGHLYSYKLNPCSYGEQSIDFYTRPYKDNVPDELYTFFIRAARGNSTTDWPVSFYASPNIDIYFCASDANVYRGKITRENICTLDNANGTIHCEFCLYHDRPLLPSMILDESLHKSNPCSVPGIERVIFNDPATIVFWTDGTKTVVKAHDEEFSEEHGLAMAMARKLLECQGCEFPRAAFKRFVRKNGKR